MNNKIRDEYLTQAGPAADQGLNMVIRDHVRTFHEQIWDRAYEQAERDFKVGRHATTKARQS